MSNAQDGLKGISPEDVVLLKDVVLSQEEMDICRKIAENTKNTWQPNRSETDKLRDTLLGKFAEKAIKVYLAENFPEGDNPYVAFYDDFRTDNFAYHNSVDFLFSQDVEALNEAQQYVSSNLMAVGLKEKSAELSIDNIKHLKQQKVCVGEIKATRIHDRHIEGGAVSLAHLLNDDFLAYPRCERKSFKIQNADDYLKEFSNPKFGILAEDILAEEREKVADWYFRVYVQERVDLGVCDAYIIGALPGQVFVDKFNIKKMSQLGRSEWAIYMSVPLREGVPMPQFREDNIPHFSLERDSKFKKRI